MELAQLLTVGRRWWWLLLIAMVIGGGYAQYLGSKSTITYTATTRLLVLQQAAPGGNTTANDLNFSRQLAQTFEDLVTLRSVMTDSIEAGGFELTADQLSNRISANSPQNSLFLDISATAVSPGEAVEIANVVSETFVASDGVAVAQTAGVVTIVEPALHVDCALEHVEARDVKGLYAKARSGEIEHFTGISDPYEAPEAPEIRVDSGVQSVEESLADIIGWLESEQLIPAGSAE